MLACYRRATALDSLREQGHAPQIDYPPISGVRAPAMTGALWRSRAFLAPAARRPESSSIGAELLEIVEGKIKEIRGQHKRVNATTADGVPVARQRNNLEKHRGRSCTEGLHDDAVNLISQRTSQSATLP